MTVKTSKRPPSSDFGDLFADTADVCRRVFSCITQLCNPFGAFSGSCCDGNCCDGSCFGGAGCGCSSRGGSKGAGCTCSTCCGCEDECEPCWYPEQLDDVVLDVCPGSTVRIKFHVFNRQVESRQFILAATGPDAGKAFGAPSTLDLGPWEQGCLVAKIRVPEDEDECALELLLWVRGCRDHVTRVVLTPCDADCSPQVERRVVDTRHDCHSWRDHFYLSTPCATRKR